MESVLANAAFSMPSYVLILGTIDWVISGCPMCCWHDARIPMQTGLDWWGCNCASLPNDSFANSHAALCLLVKPWLTQLQSADFPILAKNIYTYTHTQTLMSPFCTIVIGMNLQVCLKCPFAQKGPPNSIASKALFLPVFHGASFFKAYASNRDVTTARGEMWFL